MKSSYTKIRNGVTMKVLHDSSTCIRCMNIIAFYKVQAKQMPIDSVDMKQTYAHKVLGLITYLDNCVKSVDYYVNKKHLDSRCMVPVTKDVSVRNGLSCRESICALTYKYKNYTNSEKKCVQKRSPTQSDGSCERRHAKCKSHRQKHKDVLSSISVSDKIPGKGTLKRKRWCLEKLKNDENYEDDIFEEKKFYQFQTMFEESDSNDALNIATPKWSVSLSPREQSESPVYEDCYSPVDLQLSRKDAEEYLFRRNKRRSSCCSKTKNILPPSKAVKIEDTTRTLQSACDILMQELKDEDCDPEAIEDYYFSDVSE